MNIQRLKLHRNFQELEALNHQYEPVENWQETAYLKLISSRSSSLWDVSTTDDGIFTILRPHKPQKKDKSNG